MINITELEQKKEYLKSYRKLCIKLASLNEQKASMMETITSVKAQKYDDMPKSNNKTDLSDYIVALERVTKSIDTTRNKCISKKVAIESAILNMDCGVESDILHKRYILFKPWEVISLELGYCTRQIQRLHGRALQNIKIGGSDDKK